MKTNPKDRTEIFESLPIPKAVIKLTLPSIAASLVTILYNLADTYFVGLLNNADQSAAISFASTITLALIAIQNLFGVGGSSFFGRSLGAKDHIKAKETAAFSIWASIACGLVYSIVYLIAHNPILNALGASGLNREYTNQYLLYTVGFGAIPAILNFVLSYMVRAEGRAMHASIGIMSGCILNIILDPFFVLPQFLNMGAAGAGFATFISNCVACIYFIILLIKEKDNSYISLSIKNALPSAVIKKEVFQVGIPAAIQNLLNVTSMFVLNNFASGYGSDAVAAAGISHKLFLVPLYITMAFSQGSMPLLSYNYGSKNYKRAKSCVRFTSVIALTLGVAMAIGYIINSDVIVRLFIKDASIVEYGSGYLRIAAIAVPLMTFDFMGVALYQSFGKGKLALLLAIVRKLILEIPAMIIMNKFIPYYGLAYAQPISEGILAFSALFIIIQIFKKLEKEEN